MKERERTRRRRVRTRVLGGRGARGEEKVVSVTSQIIRLASKNFIFFLAFLVPLTALVPYLKSNWKIANKMDEL